MVRNVARCSLVHASITSAHDLVLADAELIVRGTRDGVGAGIPPRSRSALLLARVFATDEILGDRAHRVGTEVVKN